MFGFDFNNDVKFRSKKLVSNLIAIAGFISSMLHGTGLF